MTYAIKIVFLSLFIFNGNSILAQAEPESDLPKKKDETKITEVVPTDSLPAGELLNRAVNWVKTESSRYGKTNGAATSSKAECTVTFHVKPKELNPHCDYTGKITMRVIIECKASKYRYTITHIQHISASGKSSAGSIDNQIPQCGTMIMSDITWKKLKGEALTKAGWVVNDLKEVMKNAPAEGTDQW